MVKQHTYRKSMPMREWTAFPKFPHIEGMVPATRKQESKRFNQPMMHLYYKPKKDKYG